MTIPRLPDARDPVAPLNVIPTPTSDISTTQTAENVTTREQDETSKPTTVSAQESFLKYVHDKNYTQALHLSGEVPITSDILLVAYSPKTPQSLRNILILRVKSEVTEKAIWQAALTQACKNNEADLIKELLSGYTLGSRYDLISEKHSSVNTRLHNTSWNGQSAICTALLALLTLEEQKSMLKERAQYGNTPLHNAALNGHSSTCTTLLALLTLEEQKSMLKERNQYGNTPLHNAALHGHSSTCTTLLALLTLEEQKSMLKERAQDGHTPLHLAALHGHSSTCTTLLALLTLKEQKSMLKERSQNGNTPLHLATLKGHSSTCTTLLAPFTLEEQKSMLKEKNRKESTPLHFAALNGHSSACTALLALLTLEEQKSMIKEKAQDGNTPLHNAAWNGHGSTCTTLLAPFTLEEQKSMLKEKNRKESTPLHFAALNGHSSACTALLALLTLEEQKSMIKEKAQDGNTPLHNAAWNGHGSTCTTLLAPFTLEEQKSMLKEKNRKESTPLHFAALNGHSSACTALLALLTLEEQKSMIKEKAQDGNTPLHNAAWNGHGSTCTTLLAPFTLEEQKSMLKERTQDGNTPLHLAALHGHSSTCTTLLALLTPEEQKSMLKERNQYGNTLLHNAALKGHSSTCTTLLTLLTPEEQKSMLRERNQYGNTPLHNATLNGQSITLITALLAFFSLEEQQLFLNYSKIQLFYFKNYIKTCKHPFISSITYDENCATLLTTLIAFPEEVCKEHPNYNPLKIAFIIRDRSLTAAIQLHLSPEQFWTYLHALLEEDPIVAPYIADTFFSIDKTHLQKGGAKTKTEPLKPTESDFIKFPHAKDSQEVTTLVEYVAQSISHFPKEFDTLEKKREYLYPMIKQFAMYLSLFATINWTNPSEKGYIAVDSLKIEPPMGENHAPASDVLIPHLKKWLTILLYNVFFKHPFVGTPTAGTPYLKDFYEEIEHELCHLLKNFITVDHEDSIAMKKRNRSLIVLAEAGAHCGGRYATNVDEEYRAHCLKQTSSFENSVYNDLCTTRRTLLEAMNSSGEVHNGHKLLFLLGPTLGITHSPFKDPTLGLDKYQPAQIVQEKKNHLDKFLSQYTPSTALQNISMMLTCQKMKDAFVDWASDPEKKLFPAPSWAEDLQEQVQSLENHVVVSFYTEPSEKIANKKGELQELLGKNEDKGVYKRPKETGMQAVSSAIREYISQKWIAKIEEDKVVVQPYAQLRALHELKVIRLLPV